MGFRNLPCLTMLIPSTALRGWSEKQTKAKQNIWISPSLTCLKLKSEKKFYFKETNGHRIFTKMEAITGEYDRCLQQQISARMTGMYRHTQFYVELQTEPRALWVLSNYHLSLALIFCLCQQKHQIQIQRVKACWTLIHIKCSQKLVSLSSWFLLFMRSREWHPMDKHIC